MRVETVKCDVCGRVKREGNKWMQIVINLQGSVVKYPASLVLYSADAKLGPNRAAHEPGCPDTHPASKQDICSDTCLQKRLGAMLKLLRGDTTVREEDLFGCTEGMTCQGSPRDVQESFNDADMWPVLKNEGHS